MMDRIAKPMLALLLLVQSSSAMCQAKPEAMLRTEGPLVGIRLNKNLTQMAFTDQHGQSLRVMDLETQDIIEVTPHRVGEAFFWSPDGHRLFYRELIRDKQAITSEIKAYDTALNDSAPIDTIQGSSGYLTLDPRDYTVYMMHEKGILSRRLDFPGERFASWQKRAKVETGRFVATQKSVLWLSDLGLTLNTLIDDGSGVESFDISPDGKVIAWTTKDTNLYISSQGEAPKLLGRGRDPRWHPFKSLLLYSAARTLGIKAYDYDIRISDLNGQGRFLTNTPNQIERWPQWWADDSVLYTLEGSTDLWQLRYREDVAKTAPAPHAPTKTQ